MFQTHRAICVSCTEHRSKMNGHKTVMRFDRRLIFSGYKIAILRRAVGQMRTGATHEVHHGAPVAQLSRPPAGMFDVDLSSIAARMSTSPVGQHQSKASHACHYPTPVFQYPQHATTTPVHQHQYPKQTQQHVTPAPRRANEGATIEHGHVCVEPPRCVDNCEVITAYSKPRVVSFAFYSLLRGDTIERLYIFAMCAGVIAVAISVPDQKRIFLGFALFQGVFLPTVVVHSMLLLHSVPAMLSVVLFLVCAPLSVPLGIIYETHVFNSSSVVMAAIFHLFAGGGGITRILSILGLLLFSCFFFGGVLYDFDKPDQPMVRIILPLVQIIYVCASGVASLKNGIKAGNCECFAQPMLLDTNKK